MSCWDPKTDKIMRLKKNPLARDWQLTNKSDYEDVTIHSKPALKIQTLADSHWNTFTAILNLSH